MRSCQNDSTMYSSEIELASGLILNSWRLLLSETDKREEAEKALARL